MGSAPPRRCRAEYSVVPDQVRTGRRHKDREPAQELGRVEDHHLVGASNGALQAIGEPAVGEFREPLLRERRTGAVSAEVCETLAIVRVQVHSGV
jgi:hypothetical protein